MAEMVRMDEDVRDAVNALKASEKKRGAPVPNDTRALNWLAREGARAMKLATAKKETGK